MTDMPFSFEEPVTNPRPKLKSLAPGQDPLHWLMAMRGAESRRIMHAIFEGDPLGLIPLSAATVRKEALMLHPERLLEACMIEVAYQTELVDLGDIHKDWLEKCATGACTRLVNRDIVPPSKLEEDERDDRYPDYIVDFLGVPKHHAKDAAKHFNQLIRETREAFFDVYCESLPIEEYYENTGETQEQLTLRIGYALTALGLLDPNGKPTMPKERDILPGDNQ